KSLSSSEIAARLGIKVGYIDTTLSYLNSVGNLSPRANRSSSVRRATQERRHRVLHHYYEQGLSASEISKLEQVGSSVVSQDFRALEKEFGGKGLALVESAVSQGKLTPSAIDNFYQFETNRRIRRKTARTAGMLRSAQG
ncbi:MAG TPA: hypothetical protein VEY30_08755, partial [Myxococcaceae bacterium]|nr:hypothetical protein [Myxococcaceae bacterium]